MGGKISRESPQIASTWSDQSRFARSNKPELEPRLASVTNSPVSFVSTQSPSMLTWAIWENSSGSWRAIHKNRAGEVIDTQSPARS